MREGEKKGCALGARGIMSESLSEVPINVMPPSLPPSFTIGAPLLSPVLNEKEEEENK